MSDDELGIFKNDYQEKCLIEKNKFFKIYSAKNVKEERQCCLKIIDKEILKKENNSYLNKIIEREIYITKLCNSENTINFYKRMESSKSIILEFEITEDNLNLSMYLENNEKFIDKIELFKKLIRDLATALKTIHQKGVIHRDIRPSNIFININENEELETIKLGEFGNAILKKDNKFDQVGQLFYSAPEIIQNLKYDEKCDLWSLGIVLYESYFECLPYGAKINKNVIMNTLYNYYKGKGFIFQKTKKASLDILFFKLLQIEPEKRFSSDELYDLVFVEDFLENEDNFLQNNEKYRNIYKQIPNDKVDEKNIEIKEIKEGNNLEERKKQNLEKIISFSKQGSLPDLMDFPNGSINGEEKYNNILYYDENVAFMNLINKDADLFEQHTLGAFILCMNMDSLKLLKEEIVSLYEKDKRMNFNLITTGSKCENIILFINEDKTFKECIKNICIYCKNKEKWSSLKNKYSEIVRGVYDRNNDIITNFIEKFSSKDIKAYPIKRLIDYNNYNKYYKTRHKKIASYYGELNPELYKQNIIKIKSLIEESRLQNEISGTFNLDKEIEQLDDLIIKQYTNEPFFGDLNNFLREGKLKEDSYEVISYFTARLIYKLNDYAIQRNSYINIDGKILKRGDKMYYSSLLPYIRNKGKIISLTSFTYITKSIEEEDLAKFDAGRNEKNLYQTSKKFSVIFIITNNFKDKWISNLIYLQNESDMQQGIILLPFSFYFIKDIIIDFNNHTADIFLETVGKKEILEEKIKEGKEIHYNYIENIIEVHE